MLIKVIIEIMRIYRLIIVLIMILTSCSKKEDNIDSVKVFNDLKGSSITITNDYWYTTKVSNTTGYTGGLSFLDVKLKLIGFTNGDSVKVKTYGYGLINYEKVKLDNKKAFNDTITISFLVISTINIPKEEFTKSTTLLIFKGSDTLNVSLISGQLKY